MFVSGRVQERQGRRRSKEMGTLGRRKIEKENDLRIGGDWRRRRDCMM